MEPRRWGHAKFGDVDSLHVIAFVYFLFLWDRVGLIWRFGLLPGDDPTLNTLCNE